jgi:putative inorganic carbon (HCO3(-)) transporter
VNDPVKNLLRRLCEWELWLVLSAVGLSALSERLLLPAALLAFAFWPLRWLAAGRFSRRTPADWAIGLLALMSLVSLGVTTNLTATKTQTLRLLCGVGLYYAIANWRGTPANFRRMALAAGATMTGLSLYAFLSVDWPMRVAEQLRGWIEQPLRWLPGDVVNANVLAGSLALLMPLCLAGGLEAWRRRQAAEGTLLGVMLAAAGGVLALSGSRGAWLGVAVGVCVMIVVVWRWGWLALLPLGALVAAGLAWLPRGWERLLEALTAGTVLGGFSQRIAVWARALTMIQDFSISGVGMGGFGDTVAWLYPLYPVPDAPVPHAHNLYLQIAADLGLPGLIAWLAAYAALGAATVGFYRSTRRQTATLGYLGPLALGLVGSMAALTAHGLMDAVTWGMVRSAPLVWGLWGLAAAVSNLPWAEKQMDAHVG